MESYEMDSEKREQETGTGEQLKSSPQTITKGEYLALQKEKQIIK